MRTLPFVKDEVRVPTARQLARRSRTDEKISQAVLALVRRDGLDAVTIDNVAVESGVAKTTIYRRYEDRYEMLSGVAEHLSPAPAKDYPLTQAGLAEFVTDIQRIFEERVGLAAIGALLASRRANLAVWRERMIAPNVANLRTFFTDGVTRGVLVEGFDYQQLVEMILGGFFVTDALRGEVPDDWSEKLVAAVWPLISTGRELEPGSD